MKPILPIKKSGFNSRLESRLQDQILNPQERKNRWTILGVASSIPTFLIFSRFGLTQKFWTCPFFKSTGIPCPSCGLTRSLISLSQGEITNSLQYHSFGLILTAIATVTIPYVLTELILNKKFSNPLLKRFVNRPSQWLLGIFFLSYYFYRLGMGYPDIFYEAFS
jgi:hypothetical protein